MELGHRGKGLLHFHAGYEHEEFSHTRNSVSHVGDQFLPQNRAVEFKLASFPLESPNTFLHVWKTSKQLILGWNSWMSLNISFHFNLSPMGRRSCLATVLPYLNLSWRPFAAPWTEPRSPSNLNMGWPDFPSHIHPVGRALKPSVLSVVWAWV